MFNATDGINNVFKLNNFNDAQQIYTTTRNSDNKEVAVLAQKKYSNELLNYESQLKNADIQTYGGNPASQTSHNCRVGRSIEEANMVEIPTLESGVEDVVYLYIGENENKLTRCPATAQSLVRRRQDLCGCADDASRG